MMRDKRRHCVAVTKERLVQAVGSAPEELDPDLRDHLDRCSLCQAEYAALRQAYAALPPAPSALPPRFVRKRVRNYARESAGSGVGPLRKRSFVRSHRRVALVGSLLAIAATLAIVFTKPTATTPIANPADAAPVFQAIDVTTGAIRSFDEFRGKPVLLNFWATWCVPCESEMASMERLYRQYRDAGFVVVAVSVDRESRHKVRQWVERRGLTFPVLQDATGEVERLYGTFGVPESFVIDPTGAIVLRAPGPREWDDPMHAALVRDLLDAKTQG